MLSTRLIRILAVSVALLAFHSDARAQHRGGGRRGSHPASTHYYGDYGPWAPWGAAYTAPYGPVAFDGESEVRLRVKPADTEVYVDGYRAGVVDDYDGLFQRLRLEPGEYEIVLYLDGYRTVRRTLSLNEGEAYKITHEMERLGPGESSELPPEAPPESPPSLDVTRQEAAPAEGPSTGFGVLVVRVQPAGSALWIDGEAWLLKGAAEVSLHLGEGTHRVEVRKAGHQTFHATVDVRASETSRLNVILPRVP